MELAVQETAEQEHQVTVSGEIDAYTASELRDTLIPLTEGKGATVIVVLSNVDYMDSTALGIFVAALKSSKKYDSHLKLQGMTDRVRRLFDITGLDEIIDIEYDEKGKTT